MKNKHLSKVNNTIITNTAVTMYKLINLLEKRNEICIYHEGNTHTDLMPWLDSQVVKLKLTNKKVTTRAR